MVKDKDIFNRRPLSTRFDAYVVCSVKFGQYRWSFCGERPSKSTISV